MHFSKGFLGVIKEIGGVPLMIIGSFFISAVMLGCIITHVDSPPRFLDYFKGLILVGFGLLLIRLGIYLLDENKLQK